MVLFLVSGNMSRHFAAVDGTDLSCMPQLSLYSPDMFSKLHLYRTHFLYYAEYLNVPLMAVLKNNYHYSFEHFASMLKVYLGL